MNSNKIFKNPSSVFAAVIGTALESYDVMLFAHFLFVLVPLFFPEGESASLMGFTTFAIGTIFRPLGGTIFGHLGDRWGRRKALVLALFLSSFPTFLIGFIPSYAQIGFAATVILIICRILQNVSASGETPGAACILMEQTKSGHRNFASSLINIALNLGGILATLVGYICTKYLPEWGWRVPFILAAVVGLIGFYVRYRTVETPIFEKIKQEKKIEKIPLINVVKHNWRDMLCTFGLCAAVTAPFPILYVYLGDILKNTLLLESWEIMLINSGVMAFAVFSLLFFGWLADKLGARVVMMASMVVFCIVAYPMFNNVKLNMNLQNIIFTQLVIKFLSSGIMAPLNVVAAFMYPPGRRYTGLAFSWGAGYVIFCGCSPLICKLLEKYIQGYSSPGIFLVFCGFLGFLGVYYARHYQERIKKQVGVRCDNVEDSLEYCR